MEFDDQGRFWDREQIDLVESTLRAENEKADSSGVSVVVFAHGWRHGCDVCDENVACFRTFLKQIRSDSVATSRVSAGRVRPKRIVAIYTGWRGRSAKIQPLEDLSFWARKQVARRIAEGDFIELLTRVELFARRANQTDAERVRLAIMGHSFGGTIVYASLANILKARVLEARDAPAGADRVIRGYGDLIVLINPAFEASLYAPLNELAAGFGAFSPLQPPVLLTIASETDRPNRLWFPLGRYLETRRVFIEANARSHPRRHHVAGGADHPEGVALADRFQAREKGPAVGSGRFSRGRSLRALSRQQGDERGGLAVVDRIERQLAGAIAGHPEVLSIVRAGETELPPDPEELLGSS